MLEDIMLLLEDLKIMVLSLIVMIIMMAVIMAVIYTPIAYLSNNINKNACKARWENSGLVSEYSFLKGCILTLPDGRKIPEENYRKI